MCQSRIERGSRKRRYCPNCRTTAGRWRKQHRAELGLSGRSEAYGCVACGQALPPTAGQDKRSDHWFCGEGCRSWWREKRQERLAWHQRRTDLSLSENRIHEFQETT